MKKLILLAATPLVLLVAVGLAWAEDAPFAPCGECHDTVAAAFATNPHARASAQPCTSCHGDGAKHAESGDPALIEVPKDVNSTQVCMSCHAGAQRAGLKGEGHAASGVSCASCHQIHNADLHKAPLLRNTADTLCATCHPTQQHSFTKPFSHKLGFGGMNCVSCHNPHGGNGRRSLKGSDEGQLPCLACHGEKKGPFVFEHVNGVASDCLSCHERHGASNPKRLLRARVDQLCLECHSPTGGGFLGSQPPSFHDLRTPRYRECTVCHVAIHGSNTSPALLK